MKGVEVILYNSWSRKSPPAILASTPYVGWICCCFSPLLREVLSGYSGLPSPLNTTRPTSNSIWNARLNEFLRTPISAPWVNKSQLDFFLVSPADVGCWTGTTLSFSFVQAPYASFLTFFSFSRQLNLLSFLCICYAISETFSSCWARVRVFKHFQCALGRSLYS